MVLQLEMPVGCRGWLFLLVSNRLFISRCGALGQFLVELTRKCPLRRCGHGHFVGLYCGDWERRHWSVARSARHFVAMLGAGAG